MNRTESFNEWRYLIHSIADTSEHTMEWGERRVPNHDTTFELSVYNTTKWLGYRDANSRTAMYAASSSSHATGTRGYVSQPGQERMNGRSKVCGTVKKSRPLMPPNPHDVDASTNIGVFATGSSLRMN